MNLSNLAPSNGENLSLLTSQSQILGQEGTVALRSQTDSARLNLGDMDAESLFDNILRQVGLIGQVCKDNFTEAMSKLGALENRNATVEDAVSTLLLKDQGLTNIVKNQSDYNESAVKAFN